MNKVSIQVNFVIIFPVVFIAFYPFGHSTSAVELGDEIIMPNSPLPAHDPAVSYGNERYLVVWQSGKAEKADSYGCLPDKSGKILTTKPFVIYRAFECQKRLRRVWGKGIWLTV